MNGPDGEVNTGRWRGHDLGSTTVSYTERDAILYALAVGARATDLDLVYEPRLRVLPTFALTLGQWAPDALGAAGAFDTSTALHGAQKLRVLAPMPPNGSVSMRAHVAEVWDKGSAAVFEIAVESEFFVATWSLFAPGYGGFGGERGPGRDPEPHTDPDHVDEVATFETQAALYRLLGDRHAMHIDPEAARAAGQPQPFLHGLCTLASSVLRIAEMFGVHPADVSELEARFAGPMFSGDRLTLQGWDSTDGLRYTLSRGPDTAISGARVRFGSPSHG